MTPSPDNLSAWSLIAHAGPMVKLIMLLLFAASVLCWGIFFQKWSLLRKVQQKNRSFIDAFWSAKTLEEIHQHVAEHRPSSVAQVFEAGYRELRKIPATDRTPDGLAELHNIERAMNRAHTEELDLLESRADWLATCASAAPFVGLFGTVWGIMNSFQGIGAMGSASLSVVAPGISEALIATAIGLAAAIPAVIAYNWILQKVRRVSLDMENFSKDFLNMIQRSLLSQNKGASHGHDSQS